MYFQIENTPEHIRRARKTKVVKEKIVEEIPRLVIAPFSRPPQVVFENVVIGTTSERSLEIFNPSKQTQQITLGKALPPDLVVQLPGEWLTLEPETCYSIILSWRPVQPTALRETIRFTNDSRGRFDVIVVLKTAVIGKVKSNQPKFKTSPGKMKKKMGKRSPVAVYKKKSEIIYNSSHVKTVDIQTTVHQNMYSTYNKENVSSVLNDYSIDSKYERCPFGSPNSIDLNFDTKEVFSNMRTVYKEQHEEYTSSVSNNVFDHALKPSNKPNTCMEDVFDNLTFTPLKSVAAKHTKLGKAPNIVLTMNSDSEFDDSLDLKQANKENETHSIVSAVSTQPNKWLGMHAPPSEPLEIMTNKKIPNTSSPKELHSPNFSINTDFSRISDLSFFPPRFSTEKKVLPRANNETHDIIEDHSRLNSDTFTKESPNNVYQAMTHGYMDAKQIHYQQPKVCRQSLFKEYQAQREAAEKQYLFPKVPVYETNAWQNDLRADTKSPPLRSLTPPLQSIPEESAYMSETQSLGKPDKRSTFNINRTFDKFERPSLPGPTRQSWSKRDVRADAELWKVPVAAAKKSTKSKMRESLSGKASNKTFDANKSIQNATVNRMSNVYSQSLTVDPFLSSTYFYDEEAVDKFETEFKRWLNCILTPPAELESNVEIKIDVGKAWLENRNKDIPLAPTKEQVCSRYHTSHRLASLRRAARALLMSPEMATVFQKLAAQIDKKLIAIRPDRNLHLDVGLQKAIMELLLSYNPLWLRIGLEAIYGLVLPLKSNSDIEGLTTFIIQRMFKNPFLKNKHTKSNAPNMLLPAYMEAIKKFTLKKFFMLVFFLDQAKQKKLISHDPCLFCRNAVCKESREIVIRFTRELIAGIGDITKHLRPLGYVVSHKQSYIDEYKFAVNNIALDIRDGVRITKVMEIILMKNNLVNQLRTPAISRLQKIHNVSVALNSLKEANFVIVGDISPNDIADGHREKTLSLLWQIIHVFRAPLFEKAANVIQVWWRKKYEVIVAKRIEEQRVLEVKHRAASLIQCWWRTIQYARYVKAKMQQVTRATIVVQKYARMWLCRSRFQKFKKSVSKIEAWYRGVKLMREAKAQLQTRKLEREELLHKSATKIQVYVRRWLCMRRYEIAVKRIVLLQSLIRCYILRHKYLNLKSAVICIQRRYRANQLMKAEMRKFEKQKQSAIKIQSTYRMFTQLRIFTHLKKSVKIIEEKYKAILQMREAREHFLKIKQAAITIQAKFRAMHCQKEYLRKRSCLIQLQRRFRANQLMKTERKNYHKTLKAVKTLQIHVKAYQSMKKERASFLAQKKAVISVQVYFRSYLQKKVQRKYYLKMQESTVALQRRFRALLAMRKQRAEYLKLREAVKTIQLRYRAMKSMKSCRKEYEMLRKACIVTQRHYRAQKLMRQVSFKYSVLKASAIVIQRRYRAHLEGKRQRLNFLKMKNAAIDIQKWYRSCQKTAQVMQQYHHAKQAILTLQRTYRAFVAGKKQRQEYMKIRTATVCIQKRFRLYTEMKSVRNQFIQLKAATVTIQRRFRSNIVAKAQRKEYLKVRNAITTIQMYYRLHKETVTIRHNYVQLREKTIYVQRIYRSILLMREERSQYLKLKQSAVTIQQKYRAVLAMRKQRAIYLNYLKSALVMQRRFRAQKAMKEDRSKYNALCDAVLKIQMYYRARQLGKLERLQYETLKKAAVTVQQRYRAKLCMKKSRNEYLKLRSAVVTIQKRFRAYMIMKEQRAMYMKIKSSCCILQRRYRAHLNGKQQRQKYNELKSAVMLIQQRFRLVLEVRKARKQYIELRNTVIFVQRLFRAKLIERDLRRNKAATKIQEWYKSVQLRDQCRNSYLNIRQKIVFIQSTYRMKMTRNRFIMTKNAALIIQRYYRAYKLGVKERTEYLELRRSAIKLQAFVRCHIQRKKYLKLKASVKVIQEAYRQKRQRDIEKEKREKAAVCIQKNFRRYIIESRYNKYRQHVIAMQKLWRSKLVTRLQRCEYLQKINMIIRLQAKVRGYLLRNKIRTQKEELEKAKEEKRINHAASKIQALFRGHLVRKRVSGDRRVAELRRRWREGALRSTQESLHERYVEAMDVLTNAYGIKPVIRAFRSLDLLTEVFPMMFSADASRVVQHVVIYMSVTNRSLSSVEVLKCAAATLVNLARYKVTGPQVYNREHISPILKFMWRFSNSETQLFCILCTYLWLFNKYDGPREDLRELLHIPENSKMLGTIKANVDRMKRMADNACKTRLSTTPNCKRSMNMSTRETFANGVLPALEPDYGIKRANKPPYFEDASQAVNCLFRTYGL